MKRILLIALLLTSLVGTVSAYGLYLNCTDSIAAGLPMKCTVDSDFPAGTTFNLVLYQSGYTATEIRRQAITVQDEKNTQYLVVDTTGLPGGTYKAELQFTGADEPRLRSDSKTVQLITIIDRSGEIEMTSPESQSLDEALRIEGSISKESNNGVEMEVSGPDGRIYGPEWIQTKDNVKNGDGTFTQKITVTSAGEYHVDFTDAKGFIGRKTITVVGPTTAPTVAVATTAAAVKTTKAVTTAPTPWPTTTQASPLSPLPAIVSLALAGMVMAAIGKRRS
jgi:hypothetical protein